ncbi:extracellular solute-binding protein [Arthrobacter sp. FW305-BF8]|uniref:ABC transporter substrate-binding protein n=1 Tax=Arthrobacter sp. FW305-BF8 TaxID=2879617 RepID=UPI001F2BEA50|nr:extracellular solute-binding protein [Arthrobacter sp. FW305-BF8]UKA53960.1 extracellular solute-binding protein [Arthrobacter sp. FW305-BF8]
MFQLKQGRAKALTAALAAALLAGCAPPPAGNEVTLNFFQFKPEAIQEFAGLIDEFEAANPGIRVLQNNVPDPDTAIRTLLVKDKTPDVLTLNGNASFGLLAKACVFADLSKEPSAKEVLPAVQDILNANGRCNDSEINGLPMANNASGILYNPELFAKYGVSVPRTWDELIAAAETFKAHGVAPFYMTLKDAWTTSPALVNLAAQLQPEGFFDRLNAAGADRANSPVSFSKDYQEVADKLLQLFKYAQPGAIGVDYASGNKAFADGKAAMYLNGSFAVPAIRAANRDAKIASFPYPVTNDAAHTTVVSGVDVALAMGRETPHRAEAQKFINFLMSKEVIDKYAKNQSAFAPIKSAAPQQDPALKGLASYFTAGKVAGYMDHRLPPSIPLVNITQQFVLDADKSRYLNTLDNEWFKIAARTPKRGDQQ